MPTRRERKLHLRETLIIESAARLIERVGYTHLTMDMLSEEVGIAKATLYQHFKNKEEIMIVSTIRALENLKRLMDGLDGAAIDQLRAIMRYMMLSSYDSDGFPSMVMHDEVLRLFREHADIGAAFQALNERLFALVTQAKSEGAIALDLPEAVIITLMMNAIQTSKAHTVYPDQSQESLVMHTLRIFFHGLRPL